MFQTYHLRTGKHVFRVVRRFPRARRTFCCFSNAADESDCAARDRPDRSGIRSAIATPVAAPAVTASAMAVASSVAAPAVAAVAAVCTSFATGALFSALPAHHFGERGQRSFRGGDGREARPHNWW